MPFLPVRATLVCLLVSAVAAAQVVDYPDGVITAPMGQYPMFTPRDGSACRVQIYCPPTFAGLPATRRIVSRVGFQLAGQEDYATFVLRAGTTHVNALGSVWSSNLPDQRVQLDLSNTRLRGGKYNNAPVNVWIDYDIRYPFLFTPGDALVVDIVSKSNVAGDYCRTAFDAGVSRAFDLAYTSSTTATMVTPNGGIKLRFVFQPLQFVAFGQPCAGAGGFKPALAITGNMNPNQLVTVRLASSLGGAPTIGILGLSSFSVPLPIGGECRLLMPLDLVSTMVAQGSGPGQGVASMPILIPNDSKLIGTVLNAQWAQLDAASKAVVPFTLSNGGKIVVH